MKPLKLKSSTTIFAAFTFVIALNAIGCKVSQSIADKSGAQLWGENCQRCHNTPTPASFSPDQWHTIGMHMQTRALITEQERNKIVEFLQQDH